MIVSQHRTVLVLAGLLILIAVSVALLYGGTRDVRPGAPSPPDTAPFDTAVPSPTGGSAATTEAESAEPRRHRTAPDGGGERAAVAWIEDRDARLRGRVTLGRDRGTEATLICVAGPNRGSTLQCAADGSFESGLLLRGYARFEVSARGEATLRREVLLRPGELTRLDVDFGPYGHLHGRVVAEGDAPVPGAQVACDGVQAVTDASGAFALPRLASEPAAVVISKPGFATWCESAARFKPAPGREGISVLLLPAGGLELSSPAIGDDRPAQVYLLSQEERDRGPGSYPWPLRQPLLLRPGESDTIDDLPAGRLVVRAFHPLAESEPLDVRIRPRETTHAVLIWRRAPLLNGVLTDGSAPIAGARVVCRAVHRPRAIVAALGRDGHRWTSLPIELLPAAWQEVTTDAVGRFSFAAWEYDGIDRVVVTPDAGERPMRCALQPGQREVRVDLSAPR